MSVTSRLVGAVVLMALVYMCLSLSQLSWVAVAASKEDPNAVLEALQKMNKLIDEGVREYKAGEIGMKELWEKYLKEAMNWKYKAMEEAFPDVFGYPFVKLYNHLEWIDKNLEVFGELADRDKELSEADFDSVIGELKREKGKLEGVIERYITDQKRAQAASAIQGKISMQLPSGGPLSCSEIDGVIMPAETSQENALAAVTRTAPEGLPVTIWAMHDGESLYLALELLEVPISLAASFQEAYVAFDVGADGQHFTRDDDMKLLDLVTGETTDYFYEATYAFKRDIDAGGSHDVCAASTVTLSESGAMNVSVEILLPLDSEDRIGADPELAIGDEIALAIGFILKDLELQVEDEVIISCKPTFVKQR